MKETATEDKSLTEQLTQGSDHSLGEKVPGGPFALVGLSYLVILLFVTTTILLVIYAFSG